MIAPLLIALAAAAVTASPVLSGAAALDTSRVSDGELWRLFTGHLAHLSGRHYLMDAPVFVALYATVDRRGLDGTRLLFAASLSVSLAVTAAGWHEVYGGLSGLSCAALSALLVDLLRERRGAPLPVLLAAAYCGYLCAFQGAAGGVAVAREAHLAGTVAGVLFALASGLAAARPPVPGRAPGERTFGVPERFY